MGTNAIINKATYTIFLRETQHIYQHINKTTERW